MSDEHLKADSVGSDVDKREDLAEYDDPQAPLKRALKYGGLALLAITIVSIVGWCAARGLPGLWGVLLGAGIGGGFVLLTVISVLATSKTDPATTMTVVLGGWLIKVVVLLVVLVILRGMTFYDNLALGVTLVSALVVVLASETWGVMSTRSRYV